MNTSRSVHRWMAMLGKVSVPLVYMSLTGLAEVCVAATADPAATAGQVSFDVPFEAVEARMTSVNFLSRLSDLGQIGHAFSIKSPECAKTPVASQLAEAVRKVFRRRQMSFAFDSVRQSSITLLTEPTIVDERARLYLYVSRLENCPGPSCSITAKANLLTVPVGADEVVLMSKAVYRNDEISGEAIDAADRIVATCGR